MKTIKHEKLKGGYSMGKKIIIDASYIAENDIEIMAMYEDGEELECKQADSEKEAIIIFNTIINIYAEPLQKAIYNAGMVTGGKYTLVYCNDFGFPVALKITFHGIELCTYAQYSDCVKLLFVPHRKRKIYQQYIYDKSIMIFEGWQDLKEEDFKTVLRDDENARIVMSKYPCFDSRYIEDLEHIFINPVCIYKDYKVGVNGKEYA